MTLTKVHTDLIEGDLGGGASEELQVDTFTGDGTTVTFGLTRTPEGPNNTQVYISGVYQEKSTYSVANKDLTFSEAPAAGDSIEIVVAFVNPVYSGDHVKKSGDTMTGDLIVPNLNVANGITFGSGTDAIDEYETGSFNLSFLDAPGASNAADDTYCKYVKIGNRVSLKGYFALSYGGSSTSPIRLNGLPFSNATNDIAVGVYLNGKGSASGATFCVYLPPDNNDMKIYFNGATTNDNAVAVTYNNVGEIKGHFELSYFTDD